MSKKKGPGPLEPSKLLIELLDICADNAVNFNGYIGPEDQIGDIPAIRFYPDIFDLTKYLIIAAADIIHVEAPPGSKPPFDSKIIWVKAGSKIVIKKTTSPVIDLYKDGLHIEAAGLQFTMALKSAIAPPKHVCIHCT